MPNLPPYPVQKMKRFWRWHIVIFVVSAIVTLVLGAMGDFAGWPIPGWIWVIPFVIGGCLMSHLSWFVRCPNCSKRLKARLVEDLSRPGGDRYFYDCPDCRITWDSGFVQDRS